MNAGAMVCHVDASKGMVQWARENAQSSSIADLPVRWLVDDCVKFVQREIRRGNRYDGIIMDPPSYGRGPGGEVWKLEEQLFPLVDLCRQVLSNNPVFFILNYYRAVQPLSGRNNMFISIENVFFSYDSVEDGQPVKNAVDGVSLTVEQGEFVAVIGHNGCGKSTLAKHLNAMLLPDSGKVYVEGDDTADENKTWEIREKVGLVLQNPDNQLVASIVEEDVAFGPENLGVPPKEIRERVDKALKAVGMYEYRLHAPYKLSGGQKQRIAIAGILAIQPQCIVLDEPTAMLDPSGREEVMSTLIRLNKEMGITVVLITHYMDEAVSADRVVVMDSGKVLTQGTPGEVFSQVELLKKHRLDVPQAAELAFRLKGCGVKIDRIPLDEEECAQMLLEVMK